MNILVVGDKITDHYRYCKATRLCPEAPAPVLQVIQEKVTDGGAGLVESQLISLLSAPVVKSCYGSFSNKERVFADRTLVCRIDKDSVGVVPPREYVEELRAYFTPMDIRAVVVSDYDKGAMSPEAISYLTGMCYAKNIPMFVDAKKNPKRYEGCFALFPNEDEHVDIDIKKYKHVIRKLGAKGCVVDDYPITTVPQQVYDVTGAGDVFLAAFVVEYLRNSGPEALREAAIFANLVAGISVQHLGTYVVTTGDIVCPPPNRRKLTPYISVKYPPGSTPSILENTDVSD